MKNKWRKIGIITIAILALLVVGCNGDTGEEGTTDSENEAGTETEGQADSGESVAEALDHTITGIDAGAGVVAAAEQAVEDYGLDFTVQTSSGAAMTQALGDAIENEEPIVVTGWSPHWKFQKYELKYLEDPKGTFGEAEHINTIARKGLKEDKPEAYEILDNFYWEPADSEKVMMEITEGADPEETARQWVDDNQDKVSKWTDGVEKVDGESISLAYVAWDTEIASNNVIEIVLEDMGYEVDSKQVENGPMWNAVSTGEVDATVAAWLPGTHAEFYEDEDIQAGIEDLGPNLEGAKIGLVVPAYMEDVNSIEDLVE